MRLFNVLFFCVLFIYPNYSYSQQTKNENDPYFLKKVNNISTKEKSFINSRHFFSQQNWDSVLVYSAKSINSLKNKQLLDYSHFMRGYSFMKKKLYNETKKEYHFISPNFPFYYKVIRNLGGIALEQRNFKKAINYFETLNKLDSLPFEKSSVIHDLGISYFYLSKFNKAESFLLKSIKLQKDKKDTLRLIESYMDLANVYYEQYKDDFAIPYFEKAYNLSKKISDFDIKRKASLNMAVVEENKKNYLKALVYRKEFEKWKDSLNNQIKIWDIAQVEKKLAISQKQKQINFLESENQIKDIQRNSFFASSILLILLLISGIYFYTQKNKSHKIITNQKEELNLLNKTKDKLFAIVSHDLRSSVSLLKKSNSHLLQEIKNKNYNNLSPIVNKNATIANSSYNLLENLLNWATIQNKQLYFEIESVDLYSIVQQVIVNYEPLFNSKELIFKNKTTPSTFILADIESLKIIIRNLLDNAIKFSNQNATISIYNNTYNENLENLIIEDTGIGMSKETVNSLLETTSLLHKKKNQKGIGTGLGIHLCKNLAQKNNAKFQIESQENKGTKIIISFPKPKLNG